MQSFQSYCFPRIFLEVSSWTAEKQKMKALLKEKQAKLIWSYVLRVHKPVLIAGASTNIADSVTSSSKQMKDIKRRLKLTKACQQLWSKPGFTINATNKELYILCDFREHVVVPPSICLKLWKNYVFTSSPRYFWIFFLIFIIYSYLQNSEDPVKFRTPLQVIYTIKFPNTERYIQQIYWV